MAKEWIIEFIVQSKQGFCNPFPIDMLRYDSCYPARNSEAVNNIVNSMRAYVNMDDFEIGPINLIHLSHGDKKWRPTNQRWDTYGYQVIEVKEPYSV